MNAALPSRIGAFRIVGKIGQGGMGTVYRAVHGTLERPVALKVLTPEFSANPEYVARFLREARAVAVLRHENIVQVYDAGEVDNCYYIAMEFVDGVSLQRYSDENPHPAEAEGLNLLLQAARGLAAAHAKSLVHRDVKPENMLLGKDKILRLVDFGLVQESTSTTQLTATGACLGTPMYMAPEQADGLHADARADVYALGVTFFRFFTGRPPFDSPTVMNLLFKHKFEAPPDPKALRGDLSDNARNLLLHLLAKHPEDRPRDGQAVVDMVEGLLQGKPVPAPPIYVSPVSAAGLELTRVGAGVVSSKPAMASSRGLFAAVAVMLCLVGAGAFIVLQDKQRRAQVSQEVVPPPRIPITAPTDKKDHVALGDKSFAAGLFVEAQEHYQQALLDDPSDALREKLRAARDAAEFGRIMQSAEALEAKGDLAAAAQRYGEAVNFDAGNTAQQRLDRVRAALSTSKTPAGRQAERELRGKQAADARAARKFEEAAESYSRAAALCDDDAELRRQYADFAKECRRQDALNKAAIAEETKNYAEAEVYYKRALDLKSDDLDVSRKLEALRMKLRPPTQVEVDAAFDAAMREGQKALQAGDFLNARTQFTSASSIKPANTQPAEKLKEVEGRELLAKGDAASVAGNPALADSIFTEVIKKYPELAVDAARRSKALSMMPPVLQSKVDAFVKAQKDTDAVSELLIALRKSPENKELKELKTALENMQATSDVYAELDRVNDLALARAEEFREVDEDDQAPELKAGFEDLRKRFVGKAAAARPLFLEHNYLAVQATLDGARRDALALSTALKGAADLCERKAEKIGDTNTGAKVLGVSIGVGGDKKKAQKYRDLSDAYKKLADLAAAKSN